MDGIGGDGGACHPAFAPPALILRLHATTYRPVARSMGPALVGVITDTTRTTIAIGRPGIAWAMQGLMGVPLLPPAEMKNRILGLPNLSGYQASKMVAVSFFRMARPPSPKIWKIDHA